MTKKTPPFEPGHGYTKEDWDEVSDTPELTAEDFAKAQSFADVFPELAAKLRTGIRRKSLTKQAVSIHLDTDVIETLRAGGDGWQTRANDILRKGLRLKRS